MRQTVEVSLKRAKVKGGLPEIRQQKQVYKGQPKRRKNNSSKPVTEERRDKVMGALLARL
jgi:hypothetical protein